MLWLVAMSRALQRLQALGYKSVTYADNLIVLSSIGPPRISEVLQGAMRVVSKLETDMKLTQVRRALCWYSTRSKIEFGTWPSAVGRGCYEKDRYQP